MCAGIAVPTNSFSNSAPCFCCSSSFSICVLRWAICISVAASCIATPLPPEPLRPAPEAAELKPPTEVVPLALEVPGRSVALVPLVPNALLVSEPLELVSVSDELLLPRCDDELLRDVRDEPVDPELPELLCVPAICWSC